MRLKVQITEYPDRKRFILVYDGIFYETDFEIIGYGWAIRNAVSDFVEQYNRMVFSYEHTPVTIDREFR